MIKFVLGPSNRVYFDLRQNLPGKSVLVKNSKALLTKMIAESAFRDIFGEDITSEENRETLSDLPEEVSRQYITSILQVISLAKKAGALILGKRRVEDCISSQNVGDVLIVQAFDASISEKFNNDGKIPVIEIFSSQQLSKACGKENLLYTAVLGDFAKKVSHLAATYKEYIWN